MQKCQVFVQNPVEICAKTSRTSADRPTVSQICPDSVLVEIFLTRPRRPVVSAYILIVSAMDPAIIVLTTCSSPEDRDRIVEALLSSRLAACVQVGRVTSHFVWQGERTSEDEYQIFVKTKRELFDPGRGVHQGRPLLRDARDPGHPRGRGLRGVPVVARRGRRRVVDGAFSPFRSHPRRGVSRFEFSYDFPIIRLRPDWNFSPSTTPP